MVARLSRSGVPRPSTGMVSSTPFVRAAWAALTLLACACGGEDSLQPIAGGAAGSADSGTGGSMSGAGGTASGGAATGGAGTGAIGGSDGSGGATGGTIDPGPGCPDDMPTSGGTCAEPLTFCDYGGFQCRCEHNEQWACSGNAACPGVAPTQGTPCTPELVCPYYVDGVPTKVCECPAGGTNQWSCADTTPGASCWPYPEEGSACSTPGESCATCGSRLVCTEVGGILRLVTAPVPC